jgi:hypothetical protein
MSRDREGEKIYRYRYDTKTDRQIVRQTVIFTDRLKCIEVERLEDYKETKRY